MPIRRPRGPKPALRHLAFLKAIADLPETSGERASYEAAFLTLRLLDEWMTSGEVMADPSFPAHAAAREAVRALVADFESRTALERILDAVVALQAPDAQPVLPRVFAYGSLLENRGAMAVAADAYMTITRYVDPRAHLDLAFDALMRQGFCQRVAGNLEEAQRAYENAGILAGRARDRSRVLYSRVGEAKVSWARGNLPAAEKALASVITEAKALSDSRLRSIALHDSACVARSREDLPRALERVAEALRCTPDQHERERLLADLGNFLGSAGAFATARAALELLERVATQQETRWVAQHNLMDLAAREGSEPKFEQYRKRLEHEELPARNAVHFLRDAGRGLARFGRLAEAEQAVTRGLVLAQEAGMHQLVFELQSLAEQIPMLRRNAEAAPRVVPVASDAMTAEIEALLDQVAATV